MYVCMYVCMSGDHQAGHQRHSGDPQSGTSFASTGSCTRPVIVALWIPYRTFGDGSSNPTRSFGFARPPCLCSSNYAGLARVPSSVLGGDPSTNSACLFVEVSATPRSISGVIISLLGLNTSRSSRLGVRTSRSPPPHGLNSDSDGRYQAHRRQG